MTKAPVYLSFENTSMRIPIVEIKPLKNLSASTIRSVKYAQIAASIAEVGIIEPPVVIRDQQDPTIFHLLDGHVRLDVLTKNGHQEVVCLVATEDEAYTYNKRISRLATIQEHRMILRAIEKGVPEERLARALNVNIASIRQKKRLLDGICPEVAALLSDKQIPVATINELKKMKSTRQIEAAQLMLAMNKFTISHARALVAATPETLLIRQKKELAGLSQDKIALIEQEAANHEREFQAIERDYGDNHLDLVPAIGYVSHLLGNVRIIRYLAQHYPDILGEFQKMTERRQAA